MTLRNLLATALVCTIAVIAGNRPAQAQSLSQRHYVAANAPAAIPQAVSAAPSSALQPTPAVMSPGQDYFTQAPGVGDDFYSSGCTNGCCDSGGLLCSDSCGCDSCCDSGRFFVTADYLYVRPTFSEATAFVRQNLGAGTDEFVPLDFGYNSSYRFGGGYRVSSCGDEVRFMFTRFNGDASDVAYYGDIVPITADPPPGGRTLIGADVDARTYDLECVKIIPLGGGCGNGCGDACGSGCGRSCPAWDLAWSGGIRWADVDWSRGYTALDELNYPVVDARTAMTFHGGGIRTGLEGRRYFGCDGWLSLYGKGNVSLLLGDVNIDTVRSSDDGNTTVRQYYSNRQLIPMFDFEAGLTAQVTCHTAITAGYLFSAWNDLGFRNSFDVCDCGESGTQALLATKFDDSNILGFDGLFVRVEYAF